MPFTFSHVAAVLPLAKRLPLAALAIGAMVPDFTYVMEAFGLAIGPLIQGHTPLGLLTFCLPVGLTAWLAFESGLRRAWTETFPWLASPKGRTHIVTAALAVLLGAVTHVVWDNFTHVNGFAVERLEMLRDGGLFHILQHASSLVGGGILAWYLHRLVAASGAPFVTKIKRLGWIAAMLGILTVAISLPWIHEIWDSPPPIGPIIVRLAFRFLAAATVTAFAGPWVLRRLA